MENSGNANFYDLILGLGYIENPAEEKTLKLLKKHAIDVLETRHGNITLISDGKNLELRQKVRH